MNQIHNQPETCEAPKTEQSEAPVQYEVTFSTMAYGYTEEQVVTLFQQMFESMFQPYTPNQNHPNGGRGFVDSRLVIYRRPKSTKI